MRDADEFVTKVSRSGARALLIGRRALVALGAPVMTADYDFWVHRDDIETFNELAEEFDLHPTLLPDEARKRGRYVLENHERVDVLVARAVSLGDGITAVAFDELWSERQYIEVGDRDEACLPSIEGLILTKRIASRPKDLEDIRFLELLAEQEQQADES